MFAKLVSNLPYSPALVAQVGFYAKRLRREEATRRLGLVLTALAIAVQSFAVLSPPESANAASGNDLIYGGVTGKADFLANYDRDAYVRGVYNYAGITRAEIVAAGQTTINSKGKGTGPGRWLSWGRNHQFSSAQGETRHQLGGGNAVYSRPLHLWDSAPNGSNYTVLAGRSAKIGQFAIMFNCGNLVTTKNPSPEPPPPPPAPPRQPRTPTPPPPPPPPPPAPVQPPPPVIPVVPVALVPASRCVVLQVERIGVGSYKLRAQAETSNGATISSYLYNIEAPNGSIFDQTVSSSGNQTEITVNNITAPGSYRAFVTVTTSLGPRGGDSCVQNFTIAPPEKCPYNSDLKKDDEDCKPCPGNDNLWYKSPECQAKLVSSKTAKNLTQNGGDATATTAKTSDRIEYNLQVSNTGQVPATVDVYEDLTDVLEYAELRDYGAATYDETAKRLNWGSVSLQPGESKSYAFAVAVKNVIPTTAQGTSDLTSYDCVMSNVFGNKVDITVDCAAPKIIEQTVAQLPSTGPGENIVFSVGLASVVAYFYARSKQMNKELRLVRKTVIQSGAI